MKQQDKTHVGKSASARQVVPVFPDTTLLDTVFQSREVYRTGLVLAIDQRGELSVRYVADIDRTLRDSIKMNSPEEIGRMTLGEFFSKFEKAKAGDVWMVQPKALTQPHPLRMTVRTAPPVYRCKRAHLSQSSGICWCGLELAEVGDK